MLQQQTMCSCRKLLLCFTLIMVYSVCHAQGENNTWYFGFHVGLDFNSGTPVLLTNGQTDFNFGTAGVCDKNGNLLFYTDGTRVWNAQQALMPNGTGLMGHVFENTVIIVPVTGNEFRYYIFTLDAFAGPNGFNYSVVNMQLDNGLGDVETKNVHLLNRASEHITAVPHCNGTDTWVIVHEWNSDAFRAYLVSSAGVSTNPVISRVAPMVSAIVQSNAAALGTMKASPDGSKLAVTYRGFSAFYLYDFDNAGGAVSNSRLITGTNPSTPAVLYPYGVEFSADSRLLYMAGDSSAGIFITITAILQYDISSGNAATISNSQYSVPAVPLTNAGWGGSLQMGPDGKIYFSRTIATITTASSNEGISVIENPSVYGGGCNFRYNIIPMPPGYRSGQNLPQRVPVPSNKIFPATVSSQLYCGITGVQFFHERLSNVTAVQWNFDDPASGINNLSAIDSPLHIFSAAGIYNVIMVRFFACTSDTTRLQITVREQQVNIGNDTLLCDVNFYQLNPGSTGIDNTYLWQDGSATPAFTATGTGLFWVEVTDTITGCSKRDSIQLQFGNYPQFNLGNDTTLPCGGGALQLSVNIPGALYEWNTGSASNTIMVNTPGIYSLQVNAQGCLAKDSITITNRLCKIIVPSAFTPNGDGFNEVFKVLGTGSVTGFTMRIFNRWGQVVFETADPQKGWNGRYNGKPAAMGVYIYLIHFKDSNGAPQTLKGTVMLLR